MDKYIIDDDIDFYKELLNDDSEFAVDNSCCLLTGLPLTRNYIILDCSHTFNYLALFNEVCSQKQYNEYNVDHLEVYDIKCPYCRHKTHKLLPYISYLNKHKIHGVNSPDKYTMTLHTCSHVFLRGKNKGLPCGKKAFENENGKIFCERHYKGLCPF
jgi:hypothetical protein